MNQTDRVKAAMDALLESERANPWGPDATVLQATEEILGELDSDYLEEWVLSMPYVLDTFAASTSIVSGIWLLFLSGVKLGKQLGIGEGAELLGLFQSTDDKC